MANDLTVQNLTVLGTVSELQPAQSINATTVNEGGQYNTTYSTYTVNTDGFVIGVVNAPAGWAWGDAIFGWISASNSSGVTMYSVGGLFLSSSSYMGNLNNSLTLPVCQNESFTVVQSYLTTDGLPPLMNWWFIPSGAGSATLASDQTATAPVGKKVSSGATSAAAKK